MNHDIVPDKYLGEGNHSHRGTSYQIDDETMTGAEAISYLMTKKCLLSQDAKDYLKKLKDEQNQKATRILASSRR